MPDEPSNDHCTTLSIGGMTCKSCELLLERKLKAVPGVRNVDVNHRTGTARIEGDADRKSLHAVIREAGYLPGGKAPSDTRWLEIGVSLLVILALYHLLKAFDLVALAPSTSGVLTLGGIFVIGLVAGTSSCLAVTGGLLLAMAAKHHERHGDTAPWHRFRPLMHFNIGRLASYFILGGVVGVLGQSVTLSATTTGYVNIAVALVMLYLALGILGVMPKGRMPTLLPKSITRKIAALSDSDHPAAPMALGALTFFLPCGFTQSLQLVALASGSFLSGGLVMFTFALGTAPALFGLSALSSTAKGAGSRIFLRFSGALVLLLAVFNLQTGLALSGIYVPEGSGDGTTARIRGDVQEVAMTVTRYGYEPDVITIKAGVPVRWTVEGSLASGCTSIMTIPSLNISQALRKGENVIEFTAPEPGNLAFMCSMGMVRGTFHVI